MNCFNLLLYTDKVIDLNSYLRSNMVFAWGISAQSFLYFPILNNFIHYQGTNIIVTFVVGKFEFIQSFVMWPAINSVLSERNPELPYFIHRLSSKTFFSSSLSMSPANPNFAQFKLKWVSTRRGYFSFINPVPRKYYRKLIIKLYPSFSNICSLCN